MPTLQFNYLQFSHPQPIVPHSLVSIPAYGSIADRHINIDRCYCLEKVARLRSMDGVQSRTRISHKRHDRGKQELIEKF